MSFSSSQPTLSNQLQVSIAYPAVDSKEFLDVLTLDRKRIGDAVNTKEGAFYLKQEMSTFKQYFGATPQVNRSVLRTTIDLVDLNGGPIPPGVLAPILHGITGISSAALIYAGCTTATQFFTVVYPNLYLSATQIFFTNPAATNITNCYVVAEYLKN